MTCLEIWPCTVCLWHLRLTYFYNALPCLCVPSVNTDCHNVFAQDICQGTKWEHWMNTKQTCSLAFIVSGYRDQTDPFVCLSMWYHSIRLCAGSPLILDSALLSVFVWGNYFESFCFFGFETIYALIDFASGVCVTLFWGKWKQKTNKSSLNHLHVDLSVFDGRSFGKLISLSKCGSCGSGVEPAHYYQTVTGSIPLVYRLKCP